MEQLLQTAILSHREESTLYGAALTNSHSQSLRRKHLIWCSPYEQPFSVTEKKAPNMLEPSRTAILSHWEESTLYGAALTNSHSQSLRRKHLIWCSPYEQRFSITGKKAPNMLEPLRTAISVTGKKAPNMVQPLQRAILSHREESA